MGCSSSKGPTDRNTNEFSILVIGLDNAGKTTLTQTIKGDLDAVTYPTVGQSAPVKHTVDGCALKFFDLGGGSRIRGVWNNYYSDVYGCVYVVDSADPDRIEESKAELEKVVDHNMVRGKPLLVLANKQDLPTHLSEVDVSLGMGLDQLAMTRHKIVPCVAKPSSFGGKVDDRIWEGLRWLVSVIRTDMDILKARIKEEMEEFKRTEEVRRAAQAKAFADAAAGKEEKAEEKAPEDDTVYCTVCKTEPAVRRCAAAGWEAVCEACGTRLEAGESKADVAASPEKAASGGGEDKPADADPTDAAVDAVADDLPTETLTNTAPTAAAAASRGSPDPEPAAVGLPGAIGGDGDDADAAADETPAAAAS